MTFTFDYFKNKSGIDRFIPVTLIIDPNIYELLYITLKSISGNSHKVYFDDFSGSILLKNEDTDTKISVINTLTQKQPEIIDTYIIKNNPESPYFFSKPFGKWVLDLQTDKARILYNPIPRSDSANAYKDNDYKQSDIVFSAIVDYCYQEKALDPVCSCINFQQITPSDRDTEFCMTDLFSGNKNLRKQVAFSADNKSVYGAMSKDCHCMNQLCNSNHPFEIEYEKKVSNKCPDTRNYVFCNSNFIADRNSGINTTGDISIEQQCGVQQYPEPVVPKEPEPVVPKEPTSIVLKNIIAWGGGSIAVIVLIILIILITKKYIK